jgi:hypothetical protein
MTCDVRLDCAQSDHQLFTPDLFRGPLKHDTAGLLMKTTLLAITHMLTLAGGFALGIYALPILTAPPAPSAAVIDAISARAEFRGHFRRDLPGSDLLHWGDGDIVVARDRVAHTGKLAPGPDYQLYLTPEYVDTRADFARIKDQSVRLGAVHTFDNVIVEVPHGIEVDAFNTAVVWCESFGQFITSARYR